MKTFLFLANFCGVMGLATVLTSATGFIDLPIGVAVAFTGLFFFTSFGFLLGAMFTKEQLSHVHGLP
jgi:hypothetical protein